MHYSHITKNTCDNYVLITQPINNSYKYSLQYGIKPLLISYYMLIRTKLQYNYRKLSFN